MSARVLHVITSLPTGGAERQLELLVARSRFQTATLALYEGGPVAESMRRAGARVEVVGMQGWRRAVAPVRVARRIRRYRPDIVHVHLLAGQLWGIPAARLAGVPVLVSSEHSLMDDTIEGRPHTWWLRTLYRLLERATTATVAVSTTTASRLSRWGVDPARVVVADNGIDLDGLTFDAAARSRVRAELHLDAHTPVVGMVGRLDPVKRVDVVLRALEPLLRNGVVLVVAGRGPGAAAAPPGRRPRCQRAVRWLGARSDMRDVLSAFDAFVSASADETFGMAVVEAVVNGLPVAYVEAPALDELTELPSAVVRLPAGTDREEQRLRSAVEGLLDKPRRPDVPEELRRRYGADEAAVRVDAIYQTLLDARG